MTKHLKDMSLDELREGYEKGKVTDEEIEQHLLEQIHRSVKLSLRRVIDNPMMSNEDAPSWATQSLSVIDEIRKLAEHEYQKLKDND